MSTQPNSESKDLAAPVAETAAGRVRGLARATNRSRSYAPKAYAPG